MRRKQILFIVEVSIFSALGLILDLVCGIYCAPVWLNGGSITFAFIPIFIMGYRHGLKGGLLTGFLVGVIQILWSKYLITLPQILMDYVIPNVVLGLVGIVHKQVRDNNRIISSLYVTLSIIIVCMLRMLSLTLSGVWFWETGFIASIIYNGSYTLVSTGICLILTVIIINFTSNKILNK